MHTPSQEATAPRLSFISDPNLPPFLSATNDDYRQSAYHRGHLVSALDMQTIGEQAVREAYYLSVVAPQTPVLNIHTWRKIEKMARAYVAHTGDAIHITAGPVFLRRSEKGDPDKRLVRTIGDGVVVPTHFFRVHLRLVNGRYDVLALLVPNESDLDRDPTTYLVSLATIEDVTGFSFFPDLTGERGPNRDLVPTTPWAIR